MKDEKEVLICDVCKSDIINFEDDLYHMTTILNDVFNTHTHLCFECFHINFDIEEITTIKGK